MIGIDTNVLVRYLVQDDLGQSRKAKALLENDNERFFLCQIVLCELVWVLSFAYGYSKRQIVPVLRQILKTAQFEIEGPDLLRRAIDRYEEGSGDLADFLILERNATAGCTATATFDRKLQKRPGFRAP